MIQQVENQVLSSFLLFLDHEILKKGIAFTNFSGAFYPVNNQYNNYYTYSSPYSQFVSDFSIPNAIIPTGVYLNNTFIQTGQSGLFNIDYNNGKVYFTGQVNGSISGAFAVKDFNISIAKDSDDVILFETKHYLKPKINQSTTGINNNEFVYPCIYLRNNGSRNDPFAFGGLDNTKYNIRVLVLSDDLFKLHAVNSIVRDISRKCFPLITGTDQPFNSYGGFRGQNYNYENVISGKAPNLYISEVFVAELDRSTIRDQNILPYDIKYGIIETTIEQVRHPHSS